MGGAGLLFPGEESFFGGGGGSQGVRRIPAAGSRGASGAAGCGGIYRGGGGVDCVRLPGGGGGGQRAAHRPAAGRLGGMEPGSGRGFSEGGGGGDDPNQAGHRERRRDAVRSADMPAPLSALRGMPRRPGLPGAPFGHCGADSSSSPAGGHPKKYGHCRTDAARPPCVAGKTHQGNRPGAVGVPGSRRGAGNRELERRRGTARADSSLHAIPG